MVSFVIDFAGSPRSARNQRTAWRQRSRSRKIISFADLKPSDVRFREATVTVERKEPKDQRHKKSGLLDKKLIFSHRASQVNLGWMVFPDDQELQLVFSLRPVFFEIDFLSFRDPRDNPEIRENTDNLLDHNATLA